MKLVCLDTETTGLNNKIDKIIEIGCVDITNGIFNKLIFQTYINPEKTIPESATKIHGITNHTVKSCLPFKNHVLKFLEFIKDSTLIIHNASFDLGFINAELKNANFPILNNPFIDTLKLAREKFPGEKATLDALMKKFKISIPREKHGALLDAEILAHVYIAMTQNQSMLKSEENIITKSINIQNKKQINISQEELSLNNLFFTNKT